MFKFNKLATVMSLTAALAISGCDSTDDVEVIDRTQGANLTVSHLDANALNTYEMGDTIAVDYQLDVYNLSQPDVTIDFYLIHAESEDAEGEEDGVDIDETQLLETVTLLAVDNGNHIYSFSAEIPSVDHDGKYWIVPYVDPDDEIVEDFEDDNYPTIDNENHIEGDIPAVEIDIEQSPQHEFEFVSATVDGGIIVLDSPEVHEGTGEHHSDIIGHLDAIYHAPNGVCEDVETVSAINTDGEASELEIQDCSITADLTAEVMIGDTYVPVQLWDAAAEHTDETLANDLDGEDDGVGTYVDALGVSFAYDGDEHFFGFDIALDDDQLEALYTTYDAEAESNEVNIRLTLTDTTEYGAEHDDANNSVELSLPLFFYETAADVDFDEEETGALSLAGKSDRVSAQGFHNYGNRIVANGSMGKAYGSSSKFKVSFGAEAEMKVDFIDKAASLDAGASLDLWIFNAENTIIGASFYGQGYLAGVNTGYDTELVIFNATVYDSSHWTTKFEKTFDKSWEEDKQLVKVKFNVGPVPITIKAGIEGTVGFELTMGYALGQLYISEDEDVDHSTPISLINFGGWASGGVDYELVEAGVIIEITLIENKLNLFAFADMSLMSDDEVDPSLNYRILLKDSLDVINGRAGLFAKVKKVKWKKKWGIPYPAGTTTTTYYLWFYQTDSLYDKSWTIFDYRDSISI